jgi:hypothetical protein
MANPFCRSPASTLTGNVSSAGETPGDRMGCNAELLRWARCSGSAPGPAPRRDGAPAHAGTVVALGVARLVETVWRWPWWSPGEEMKIEGWGRCAVNVRRGPGGRRCAPTRCRAARLQPEHGGGGSRGGVQTGEERESGDADAWGPAPYQRGLNRFKDFKRI